MEENSLLHQRTRAEGILEGYLASLATSLAPVESGFEGEARPHILECAAAYEELGHDPVAAMRSAIEQFGRPREISHAMADPAPVLNGILVPTSVVALAWGSAVGCVLVLTAFKWVFRWGLDMGPPELFFAANGFLPALIALLLVMKSKLSPVVAGLLTGFVCGAGMLLIGVIMKFEPPAWSSTIYESTVFLFGVGCVTYSTVAWFLRWFQERRGITARGPRQQRLTD
jgi:hypothetical protein